MFANFNKFFLITQEITDDLLELAWVFIRSQVLIPQQRNGHDCGVFVMHYVEHVVLRDFHTFFTPELPDLATWFTQADIVEKRLGIATLIVNKSKGKLAKHRAAHPNSCTTIHTTGLLKRSQSREISRTLYLLVSKVSHFWCFLKRFPRIAPMH